ncbi:MAG: hypothetical protein WKF67_00380 [Rubrobacteraceae bacterium]
MRSTSRSTRGKSIVGRDLGANPRVRFVGAVGKVAGGSVRVARPSRGTDTMRTE